MSKEGESLERLKEKEQLESGLNTLYGEALASEVIGDIKGAEQIYLQLFDLEQEDVKHQWTVLVLLAEMYERNQMYLKMEKVGKRVCKLFPQNFYGYHIRIAALLERDKVQEAKLLLDESPENMRLLSQWMKDYISVYIKLGQYSSAQKLLQVLSVEYGDVTAMIPIGFLMLLQEEYETAIELCNFIQNNVDKEETLYVFYAKLIDTIAKIRVNSNENRSITETIDTMINYINEQNLDAYELVRVLSELKMSVDGGVLND